MTRRCLQSCALVLGVMLVVALGGCTDTAEADRAAPVSGDGLPRALVEVVPSTTETPATRAIGTAAPHERARRISLVAGGDILIHESVWESARSYAEGEGFDFVPMFEPVAGFIADADLGICHLEVPLSAENERLSSFPRFQAPYQLADAIAAAGFDGCSFASNHVLDQGVEGIEATLGHLDRVGLGHAGAARDPGEAGTIATYGVRGIRVAHLSYTYGYNGLRPPPGEDWRSNLIDPSAILDEASRARAEGADLVVASLHWGTEYVHAPNQHQRDVAAAIGDSPDIDFVIGHHAHVIQPVTVVGETWVAYGVGNLLSNMLQAERRDGVLLLVHFEAPPGGAFEVAEVEFLPTQVEIPGHRIVPAPPPSWERTARHLQAMEAPLAAVHLED